MSDNFKVETNNELGLIFFDVVMYDKEDSRFQPGVLMSTLCKEKSEEIAKFFTNLFPILDACENPEAVRHIAHCVYQEASY